MFTESPVPAPGTSLALLGALARSIAHAVDPVRVLSAAARIVHGAAAGTVLTRAGNALPLPGLAPSNLFAPGSPVLGVAAQHLAEGAEYVTFLVPRPVPGPAGRYVRITVLAAPSDIPTHLAGIVVASPVGELHGLTCRELEILGLLIEGWSNARIAAELVVTPRTVAAHLEHIRTKLGVPTRVRAAVRAQRAGTYIPRRLRVHRGPTT
nr:helix-turn-helix transcriptional regulator [Pseudonocardia acidicola]